MEFTKQTATVLHDEHMQVVAALDRFATFLREYGRDEWPAAKDDPQLAHIARELRGIIEDELPGHFAFEEEAVFPRLMEAGDGAMTALLTEEHESVLPVAKQLSALSGAAAEGSLDADGWNEFRRLGTDFIESMTGHIQKEEIGLLSAIEAIFDEDVDRELAMNYIAER